jgi:molecular chaperone DnaK (HSP70)
MHTRTDVNTVLVFDFGGGTLDISLLSLQRGTFMVRATAGDKYLGGEDITHRLVEHLVAAYTTHIGRALTGPERQRLRAAAEDAKHALSNVTRFVVHLPGAGTTTFSLEVRRWSVCLHCLFCLGLTHPPVL